MIIDRRTSIDPDFRRTFLRDDDVCWHCAAAVTADVIVFWVGIGSEIQLHVPCAQRLGLDLLRDAHRAERGGRTLPERQRGGAR